jgi:hypothetical protein
VCHRTVSGAPGPYMCQPATLVKTKARFAIIHRNVRCVSGATTICTQRSTLTDEQCGAEVRAVSQRGTRLSGAPPDCLVPQEDNAPTVDSVPNPNGWVTWRRTGQGTVPVRHNTKDQIPSKSQIHSKHFVACVREIFVFIWVLVAWIAFLLFPFSCSSAL